MFLKAFFINNANDTIFMSISEPCSIVLAASLQQQSPYKVAYSLPVSLLINLYLE